MLQRILYFLMVVLVLTVSAPFRLALADDFNEDEEFNEDTEVFSEDVKAVSGIPPKIEATAAIVLDMKSGRVLYEKNAYSKRSIASTTKIVTAIVAIENGNMEDNVAVSKRAAGIRGSTVGLKTGDTYKLKELMYGLMLRSGNDAAIAVAEHIGGTVDEFADMMTRKAKEIGAVNTSFKSPHGLDMDGHYSTAYDLAIITRYALANPLFSEIVSTKTAHVINRDFNNTNEMLSLYPGADGVKTGYTGKAGRCLVTSATRDGSRIISVVLGCQSRAKRASSSKSILDYAFFNFKTYTLIKQGEIVAQLPVIKGIKDMVNVEADEEIAYPLREDEHNAVLKEVELVKNIRAPVAAGVEIGNVKYMLDGNEIARSMIRTAESVDKKGVRDYLGQIIYKWEQLMKPAVY